MRNTKHRIQPKRGYRKFVRESMIARSIKANSTAKHFSVSNKSTAQNIKPVEVVEKKEEKPVLLREIEETQVEMVTPETVVDEQPVSETEETQKKQQKKPGRKKKDIDTENNE